MDLDENDIIPMGEFDINPSVLPHTTLQPTSPYKHYTKKESDLLTTLAQQDPKLLKTKSKIMDPRTLPGLTHRSWNSVFFQWRKLHPEGLKYRFNKKEMDLVRTLVEQDPKLFEEKTTITDPCTLPGLRHKSWLRYRLNPGESMNPARKRGRVHVG